MNATPRPLAPRFEGRQRLFCCHSATLSGRFIPNSLAAVEECVSARVPRLEIDVQFLADDTMLVFHDATFKGAASGAGRVAEADMETARRLRYHDGSPVAILAEAVDALRGCDTVLQVDLKLSRPISARRVRLLKDGLAPVRDRVIIGSQSHWNLRPFAGELPIALDPTLHWCFSAATPGLPRTLGVHGLWDDSPVAGNTRFSALEYVETRVDDLAALLPAAVEWMVDIETIFHFEKLGIALGDMLGSRGIALAAWTLRREEPAMKTVVERLFHLGAETIITDAAPAAAASLL